MKKEFIILLLCICFGYSLSWGQYIIKVFVSDESTYPETNIEGATILVDNKYKYKTGIDGFFVIKLSDGEHVIKVCHRHYKAIEFTVKEAATCLVNLQPEDSKKGYSGYSIHSEDGNISSSMSFSANEICKADSLYELGEYYYSLYLNTEEDSTNYEKAYFFYRQAADLNHPESLMKLVDYYERKGTHEEAMRFLERAANLNYPLALYFLGQYYKENGDFNMAVNWLQKGAELGEPSAQMALGEIYEKGLGVEKNIDKAMMWYDKATGKDESDDKSEKFKRLPILPQQKRIALLIGNGDYDTGRLPNVGKDWIDMNNKLKELGFETITFSNVNKREFKQAIRDFRSKVKDVGDYDAILFYYAGHGVQCHGINYLVPIGDFFTEDADIEDEYISMNWILESMLDTDVQTRVFILDACRSYPVSSIQARSSLPQGLSTLGNTPGVLMAYSTMAGKQALDGEKGLNSPYIEALLQELDIPQEPIDQVFNNVKLRVSRQTKGKQQPSHVNDLDVSKGVIYFNRGSK